MEADSVVAATEATEAATGNQHRSPTSTEAQHRTSRRKQAMTDIVCDIGDVCDVCDGGGGGGDGGDGGGDGQPAQNRGMSDYSNTYVECRMKVV